MVFHKLVRSVDVDDAWGEKPETGMWIFCAEFLLFVSLDKMYALDSSGNC